MDVEGPDDPRCEEQAPAPVLHVVGNRRIIFATPGGDIRTVRIAATDDLAVTTPPPGTRPTGEDLIIETLPLADAVALADRPGDIVQLLAVRYWLPLADYRRLSYGGEREVAGRALDRLTLSV